MAGAGFYRELYELQEPSFGENDAGQQTRGWTVVARLRGQQREVQREVMDAGGTAVRTDVTIETAWHPDVSARCRLVHHPSGRVFNIVGATDPDFGRGQRLLIQASEVVA